MAMRMSGIFCCRRRAAVSTSDCSISINGASIWGCLLYTSLKERTDLTHSRIGAPQRDSILAAGLALQQAGVVEPKVDVKATVDALIDDQVPLPTN